MIILFPIITNCQETASFENESDKVNNFNLYSDSNKEMHCLYLISSLHALAGSRYARKSISYNNFDVVSDGYINIKDGITHLAFLTDIFNSGYKNISFQKVLSEKNSVSIKVGDVIVDYSSIIKVPVLLDADISNDIIVADAAFTVRFDPRIYIESVESEFFGTFYAQQQETGAVSPYFSDCQGYDQPLVINNESGRCLISAVRVVETVKTDTLFTLNFKLKANATTGTYPIVIQPTVIYNHDIGYSTDTAIDMIVGFDPSESLTSDSCFPVLLTNNTQPFEGSIGR